MEQFVLTVVGLLLVCGIVVAAILSYESPRSLIALIPFTTIFAGRLLLGVISLYVKDAVEVEPSGQ